MKLYKVYTINRVGMDLRYVYVVASGLGAIENMLEKIVKSHRVFKNAVLVGDIKEKTLYME
jgi:hypothetical protein